MLDEFLATNRHLIAARTRERLAARESPRRAVHEELTNGIPAFLTQLGEALRLARSTNTVDHTELAKSAARHGQERLWSGVSIAHGNDPSPPALETAIASALPCTPAIGA